MPPKCPFISLFILASFSEFPVTLMAVPPTSEPKFKDETYLQLIIPFIPYLISQQVFVLLKHLLDISCPFWIYFYAFLHSHHFSLECCPIFQSPPSPGFLCIGFLCIPLRITGFFIPAPLVSIFLVSLLLFPHSHFLTSYASFQSYCIW